MAPFLSKGFLLLERPAALLVLLLAVLPAAAVVIAVFSSVVIRTLRLPSCPHCRRPKVRPAQRKGAFDEVVKMIRVFPFRCQGCLRRFYAFDGKRPPWHRQRLA